MVAQLNQTQICLYDDQEINESLGGTLWSASSFR